MKKTIKISLGGFVFQIDEDAYDQLKEYLAGIHKKFSDIPEGAEISEDIEARIAEIFQSYLKEGREIISNTEVQEMIRIIGEPSEMDELFEEGKNGSQEKEEPTTSYSSRKRLYRDPEDAILGGICSGIAYYFKIDVLVIRILFVLFGLVYLSGVLVYLILWIAVPVAETTTQKMEMRGEPISLRNIEKKIKEEYHEMKASMEHLSSTERIRRSRNALEEFFYAIGKIFIILVRIVSGIIGFSLVIAGMIALVALVISWFFKSSYIMGEIMQLGPLYFPDLLGILIDPRFQVLFFVFTFLLVAIPLLVIIYLGVRMIFQFRVRDRVLWLVFFLAWTLSLAGVIAIGITEGLSFSNTGYSEEVSHELDLPPGDTLYIELGRTLDQLHTKQVLRLPDPNNHYAIRIGKNPRNIYCTAQFRIIRSDGTRMQLEVERYTHGKNYRDDTQLIRSINYQWALNGNRLLLDEYFSLKATQRWRAQYVAVTLFIPEGYPFYISESVDDYIVNRVYNVTNSVRPWELGSHYWIFEDEKMQQVTR